MHQLDDNQAILTINTPDLEWILKTFPEAWECELLPDASEDYVPDIIVFARQVCGAVIDKVQVSVTGGLDAVEAMRQVFQQKGVLNDKRCRSGYRFLVTVQDAEARAPRARRIHAAIARSQMTPVGDDQLCLL